MIEEMYREEFGDSSDESMQREANDDSNWLKTKNRTAPSNSIYPFIFMFLSLLFPENQH